MKARDLIIAGSISLALAARAAAQGPDAPDAGAGGPIPRGAQVGPREAFIPDDAAFLGPPLRRAPRALRRRDLSWIHIDRPRPRKISVHDIITVIVDEKAEVVQNSRFNRQRNTTFNATLNEFIRIDSKGNLANAALNAPAIDGQLQSQMQSYGQGLTQEGMKYRIAATVVDVLPNGTLILEARKSIRSNTELWEYSLTGRIRTQDVAGNNTVHSENIADLQINKIEHGKYVDSTKRGIFTILYDTFLPF